MSDTGVTGSPGSGGDRGVPGSEPSAPPGTPFGIAGAGPGAGPAAPDDVTVSLTMPAGHPHGPGPVAADRVPRPGHAGQPDHAAPAGPAGQPQQHRRIPWPWVVGGLALLVLAGRGLIGLTPDTGPGSAAAPAPPAQTASARAVDEGSEPTATAQPTPFASITPTTVATRPPRKDRISPAIATPSTTAPARPITPRPTHSIPSGPGGPPPPTSRPTVLGSPIIGTQSGKCIDVAGGSSADETRIDLFTCNGSAGQAITYTAAGELRVLGKCLDARGTRTANGTPIILYTCNGQLNQRWYWFPDNTIRGAQSNRCLDATGRQTADGTPLQLWDCNGGLNQLWTR